MDVDPDPRPPTPPAGPAAPAVAGPSKYHEVIAYAADRLPGRETRRFFAYRYEILKLDYERDIAPQFTTTFRMEVRELPVYTYPTFWRIFMKIEESKY